MSNFTTDLGDDFIGQAGSGDGSYALVKVPSHGTDTFYFKNNDSNTVTMTSFLRIGAVPSDDPTTEHGWDLAKLVVGFVDDTRTRDVDTAAASTLISTVVEGTGGGSIAGDLQDRMKSFYASGVGNGSVTTDQTKRIQESKKLHYRGGWRDHSDGNRITTTLGDKVEVIRGNYKMVVLGRQPTVNDPVDSLSNSVTTWDASGGHISDWRFTPGAFTEISWVKHTDTFGFETWKVTEETVKGDVDETYHGIVTEQYLGPSVTTTTGWSGGGGTDDLTRAANDATNTSIPKLYRANPSLNRENPTITERTWAKNIYDYEGSLDCPVDYIEEITYAKRIHQEVRMKGGAAKITSEVHAEKVIEDIYVDYHSTTFHGIDKRELWMGHFGEMFLGAVETFKIGNFLDVRIGAKILETNLSMLTKTQINIAPALFSLDVAYQKADIFKGTIKNTADLCAKSFEITPGVKQAVSVRWGVVALGLFLG